MRAADSAPPLRYGLLLRSTVTLFARERLLRLQALFGLLVFAAFSALWSSIALPLSEAPYSLSHSAIRALGVVGIVHALAATVAGGLTGGYMVFYSIGSATGAIAATSLYAVAGWGAVCALGATFSCLGLALWVITGRGKPPTPCVS